MPKDENEAKEVRTAADPRDRASEIERHPRGVAVPPVPPAEEPELNEAQKTLRRQQRAAGMTGDVTPEQHAHEKAREAAMTDQPDLAAVEASRNAAQNNPNDD